MAVLPTLWFSRDFGLFLWSCGFFEDLQVTCFWVCFNWNLFVFWTCFLQISVLRIAFFSNFVALLLFQFTAKGILGVFLWKLLIFSLIFRVCLPAFLFNFVADFSLCWIFLPTHVELVYGRNCLFLDCFFNLLACFCEITRHHWYMDTIVGMRLDQPCCWDSWKLIGRLWRYHHVSWRKLNFFNNN